MAPMIRLHINPDYRRLLEQHKLIEYPQFMSCSAGELLDEDRQRDIQKLQLGDKTFFLKRTRVEKSSSALESYIFGKLAHSKPYKEMLQISYLREHGFNTAEVVAAGEEVRFGFPKRGFIITLQVAGRELPDVYRESSTSDRARIMRQMGVLLAQLHRRGFFLSVRLKDVFTTETSDLGTILTLIDREARNPAPKRFSPDRAKESLFTSLRRQARAGDTIPAIELRPFINSYCQEISDTWPVRPLALSREMRKTAVKLAKAHRS